MLSSFILRVTFRCRQISSMLRIGRTSFFRWAASHPTAEYVSVSAVAVIVLGVFLHHQEIGQEFPVLGPYSSSHAPVRDLVSSLSEPSSASGQNQSSTSGRSCVDSRKHCENVISTKIIEFNSQVLVSNSNILEHTTCATRKFFFHYSLAIILLQLQQPIVEIHQIKRLVFDNYQRCPVPLKTS